MKRLLGGILCVILVFVVVPATYAAPFNQAWVFSENRGVDSSDFPSFGVPPWPLYFFAAEVNTADPFSENVTVSPVPSPPASVPTPTLNYYPGWNLFIAGLIDDEWNINLYEHLYTFQSGGDSATWLLPQGSVRKLAFPTNINLVGDLLTWAPVPNADNYLVVIFPLDGSGNPNLDDGPLVQIGPSNLPVARLTTNLPDGDYAVAIDSREWHPNLEQYDNYINRSRYFIKTTLPLEPEPEAVPSMNQWGFIIFGILLAGSAVWFIRRRKQTS